MRRRSLLSTLLQRSEAPTEDLRPSIRRLPRIFGEFGGVESPQRDFDSDGNSDGGFKISNALHNLRRGRNDDRFEIPPGRERRELFDHRKR